LVSFGSHREQNEDHYDQTVLIETCRNLSSNQIANVNFNYAIFEFGITDLIFSEVALIQPQILELIVNGEQPMTEVKV
jgi:hypothetical protein